MSLWGTSEELHQGPRAEGRAGLGPSAFTELQSLLVVIHFFLRLGMYQLQTLILDRIQWSYLSLEFSWCAIFKINLISLTDTAPFRSFFFSFRFLVNCIFQEVCFISVVTFTGMRLLVLQTADAKSVHTSRKSALPTALANTLSPPSLHSGGGRGWTSSLLCDFSSTVFILFLLTLKNTFSRSR